MKLLQTNSGKMVVVKDIKALKVINFFEELHTRWQIACLNYEEYVREIKVEPPAHVIEFLRTFQNYLGSVISLWEQMKYLEQKVKLSPKLRNEFVAQQNQMKENRELIFLIKLRNYIFHAMFPQLELSTNADGCFLSSEQPTTRAYFRDGAITINVDSADNPVVGFSYNKDITIQKADLLAYNPPNPHHRWNKALEYIQSLPDTIDIKKIVIKFHKKLNTFYTWFFEQFFSKFFIMKKRTLPLA